MKNITVGEKFITCVCSFRTVVCFFQESSLTFHGPVETSIERSLTEGSVSCHGFSNSSLNF